MPFATLFMVLEYQLEKTLNIITDHLVSEGYQVIRSFDLRVARNVHTNCSCPYHGTDKCNCQLLVLLVYNNDKNPVTIVIEGHNEKTAISIVNMSTQEEKISNIYKSLWKITQSDVNLQESRLT